ncbi:MULTISPECIES: hypothetical protein [Enterobacter cloacae complex]|uniref:hypothetical protein n=1 Tax=Enterobacter cloacae complex TaxID=354276 RepID=UPI0003BF1BAD|nr:hypothetical protein [Enterobacter sp. MGH 16]ESN54630.1 hypothetical protein L362_01545 [Enterobacter sp. MGH 16]KJW96111.1 hypothetical protein RZ87_23685 [Enterobacter roggenkampii]
MSELICTWTPKLIVELVKNMAWPIVVLLIGIGFHNKISGAIRFFFTKNTVSELSASTTGLSAKFVAAQQSLDPISSVSTHATDLPDEMSVEAIRTRHLLYKTEFSEEIYQRVMKHLLALNIDDKEKVELLARDISIIQSGVRYNEINKLLFRSQYNMFCNMANNAGFIRKEEAIREFESTKAIYKDAFSEWDWIKYIAYPVSNGLMVEEHNGYKLTAIGRSYLSFMSKNPQMIDDLAKI